MLLIDLEKGAIISDDEIKRDLANAKPYKEWLARSQIVIEDMAVSVKPSKHGAADLLERQQAFGYSQEDIQNPDDANGDDRTRGFRVLWVRIHRLSALSSKSKTLYTYFKQNFAQVTNPPIDPIREESVMSLVSFIGPRPNLFDLEGLDHQRTAGSAPTDFNQRRFGKNSRHWRHR